MTEDEAKTKWCPFVRIVKSSETGNIRHGQPTFNRVELPTGSPGVPVGALCIASACMAWRWGLDIDEPAAPLEHHGFCGLAGAPQ